MSNEILLTKWQYQSDVYFLHIANVFILNVNNGFPTILIMDSWA